MTINGLFNYIDVASFFPAQQFLETSALPSCLFFATVSFAHLFDVSPPKIPQNPQMMNVQL